MNTRNQNQKPERHRPRLLATLALAGLLGAQGASADILYIGDSGDNTVKRFDAGTGAFLDADNDDTNNPDAFVRSGSGGLDGPRGLLFDGHLLVSNQNVGDKIPGEILRFDGQTGALLGALVPSSDKSAPFAPRGIVRTANRVLYVANLTTANGTSQGDVRTYDANGKLIERLDAAGFPNNDYHPRAVVQGPDNLLYVTVRDLKKDGLGGHVLRFTPEGRFVDVFISDQGGINRLNRPEGLVFGPDGRLYVTSFRASPDDTDSIRIYDDGGAFLDKIDLYQTGETRVFSQAILFGPEGRLFVPVINPADAAGAVRRYDVAAKTFEVFADTPLREPWYLTFGTTNPATLAYGQ
ncbi:hypothetical protein [Azotobacter salinestris]|uniref:hypothetical protein n=1 Tax=Azotobacter salinestris TaxID=69964 RepID=UPI0032DFDD1A